MGQVLAESIFDVVYLSFAVIVGLTMLLKGKTPLVKKFGFMAVLLGAGDAFHLVPRCYALWTTGLEANEAALGFGKFVTSITMTIFYLILYSIWQDRYHMKDRKGLSYILYGLGIVRIALCLLPQNEWFIYNQPLFYGILRNIPFAIMGIILIVLFAQETKKNHDLVFRHMALAITLSFLFYIPVVLFSGIFPLIGVLMIPKTLAYVWIVLMGFKLYRTV